MTAASWGKRAAGGLPLFPGRWARFGLTTGLHRMPRFQMGLCLWGAHGGPTVPGPDNAPLALNMIWQRPQDMRRALTKAQAGSRALRVAGPLSGPLQRRRWVPGIICTLCVAGGGRDGRCHAGQGVNLMQARQEGVAAPARDRRVAASRAGGRFGGGGGKARRMGGGRKGAAHVLGGMRVPPRIARLKPPLARPVAILKWPGRPGKAGRPACRHFRGPAASPASKYLQALHILAQGDTD